MITTIRPTTVEFMELKVGKHGVSKDIVDIHVNVVGRATARPDVHLTIYTDTSENHHGTEIRLSGAKARELAEAILAKLP